MVEGRIWNYSINIIKNFREAIESISIIKTQFEKYSNY